MVPVPGGTVRVAGQKVEVKPFFIGRTEVTWDLYDVFSLGLELPKNDVPKGSGGADAIARPSQPYGSPDYGWGHAGYPVISVARQAAQAFAVWLSRKTGKNYRLPTEAEWVHRGAFCRGQGPDDGCAWTAWPGIAATRRTDASGGEEDRRCAWLSDLFGNAAEWVSTGAAGDDTSVTRGGSFRDAPDAIAAGARAVQDESWNERDPQLPKSRWWLSDGPFVGFRLVLER
jgi:formylglycine-generating enzyme required for sulfatase activity